MNLNMTYPDLPRSDSLHDVITPKRQQKCNRVTDSRHDRDVTCGIKNFMRKKCMYKMNFHQH